jgi:pimeloyl-ACP methyl ester carboxylesterase
MLLALLALLPLAPLSIQAATPADRLPALAPPSSARFDYVNTIQRGAATWTAYGSGTQIAADRVSVWSGASSRANLATFTRIGSVVSHNDGTGWHRVSDQPLGPTYAATLVGQLDALRASADAVLQLGAAMVGNVPTTHYQLWLRPGHAADFIGATTQLSERERDRLGHAAYKVDLWVGQTDQRLHQQLVTLTIPADPVTTISTLLTYTSFDDPAIAIDAPPTNVPRFELGACLIAPPQDVAIECGDLVVLADRSQPDGATLRLAVIRLPSTGPAPNPAPLVFLAGGPGQGASGALQLFTNASLPDSALRENHTLLLIDQRGTGFSQPMLICPEVDALATRPDSGTISPQEAQERGFAAFAACRTRLLAEGVSLADYTTAENAADINDLRLALGYEQVDLYRVSYGSRLALTVMRDFPQAVRSVVLTSPLPPQADLLAGRGLAFNNALETLSATCANDPACNESRAIASQSNRLVIMSLTMALYTNHDGNRLYNTLESVQCFVQNDNENVS